MTSTFEPVTCVNIQCRVLTYMAGASKPQDLKCPACYGVGVCLE